MTRKIGDVLIRQGQRYTVVALDKVRNRFGGTSVVVWWESRCAECGAPFQCGLSRGKEPENRRCSAHKAPGVRVMKATVHPDAAMALAVAAKMRGDKDVR